MKRNIGVIVTCLAVLMFLIQHYFAAPEAWLSFGIVLLLLTGLLLVIPFELIPAVIFDNHEWLANDTLPKLIKKIRLRAILFNNISVVIFGVTLLVIVTGFYILINPQIGGKPTGTEQADVISVRIAATAILIFLVQILFRVFKYLLRVAAFYNGKADALELNTIMPDTSLKKVMEMFTPDKYDISDVASPSLLDKLGGK